MQCGRSMGLTIMQQKHTQYHPWSRTSRHPVWLLSGFWFCVVISIAVVLRRLNALIRPSHGRPPQMAAIDATFSSHLVLTVMHIIPAIIFVVLAAGILLRRIGGEWLERLFFAFGAMVRQGLLRVTHATSQNGTSRRNNFQLARDTSAMCDSGIRVSASSPITSERRTAGAA